MQAVKITENVYWVGAIDWNLRNFHGYLTQRGSTYNAYLIIDEKVTLIDNVKEYCTDEMLARISSIIDPSKIDVVIQNHIEMDHSGSLPKIMSLAPNAELYCSPNAVKGLKMHYNTEGWKFNPVKSSQTLSLGKNSIAFTLTPMVHWPDNMVTYCPEQKILFSNDAFGQHIASNERIDTDYPESIFTEEAKKYYANIVLPYGKMVMGALKAVAGLKIDLICPSHGLILKQNIAKMVELYTKWASNEVKEKALIIYDSMWGSTEKMAKAIAATFEEKNITFELLSLQHNHISDVMTHLIDAKYICLGSPTLNNNILPTVAQFLAYLKGLAPQNRIGFAFGSFGWGGQSIKMINDDLESVGFKMLKSAKIQYVPCQEGIKNLKQTLAEQL